MNIWNSRQCNTLFFKKGHGVLTFVNFPRNIIDTSAPRCTSAPGATRCSGRRRSGRSTSSPPTGSRSRRTSSRRTPLRNPVTRRRKFAMCAIRSFWNLRSLWDICGCTLENDPLPALCVGSHLIRRILYKFIWRSTRERDPTCVLIVSMPSHKKEILKPIFREVIPHWRNPQSYLLIRT